MKMKLQMTIWMKLFILVISDIATIHGNSLKNLQNKFNGTDGQQDTKDVVNQRLSFSNDYIVLTYDIKSDNNKDLFWKSQVKMLLRYNCVATNISDNFDSLSKEEWMLKVFSQDVSVAKVSGQSYFSINCSTDSRELHPETKTDRGSLLENRTPSANLNDTLPASDTKIFNHELEFTLDGIFLGYTKLNVIIFSNLHDPEAVNSLKKSHKSNSTDLLYIKDAHKVKVLNKETILNKIFIVVVAIFVMTVNFGFGCRIDLQKVKQIFRRPVAPALGLFCQIIIMPLLGLGITKMLFMSSLLGFGLFVVSCSPGGNGSNVYTFLLSGDVDLSLTMTFISKTLALGTMTVWLFALSRLYVSSDVSIEVPYINLTIGLISLAIPIFCGILLQKFKPHVAVKVVKCLKPISLLFVLWVSIVGSITNMFMFTILRTIWSIIPAACLLGYCGMLAGYVISKIARQNNQQVTAISIETGVQDTGVGILLLLTSFEKPLSSIATTMPIACSMFASLPLIAIIIVKSIYEQCWKKGHCQIFGGPEKSIMQNEYIDDRHEIQMNGPAEEKDLLEKKSENCDVNCNSEDVEHSATFNRNQQRLASKHYKTKL